MLEVRVLAGVHRHARCAAQDDAIVGASPSCDIVLLDQSLPAQAARLNVLQDGWRLQILDTACLGDGTPDEILGFGRPAWLGPVCLTIAPLDTPWADPPELPADSTPADAEPAHDEFGDHSPPTAAHYHEPLPSRPHRRRTARTLALAGGATLALAGLAWPLTVLLPAAGEHETPANTAKQVQTGSDHDLFRAMAAINGLQLASDVHVARRDDGTIWVTGWLQTEAQCDRLAAALADLDPRPIQRVGCAGRTEGALRATLDNFDAVYRLRHLGKGRFQVRAIATGSDSRMAMIAALNKASAGPAGIVVEETDILLASEVGEAFQVRLKHAGLPPVVLTWKKRALQVQPEGLTDEQASRLRSLVDAFNKDQLDVLQMPSPDRGVPTLPFGVRSVIGGQQPWLLLEDGTKLLVGGTHCNYRLVAIEDKQIVFDANGTITIPR
jgi:type III secretion protein D